LSIDRQPVLVARIRPLLESGLAQLGGSGKGRWHMIVVTGATGTVGARLVDALKERKADVRVLVRSKEAAPPGVEVAVGDLADPASLAPAVAGAEAIYLLAPVHPEMARYAGNVIDAAVAAGRPRVVLQAAVGIDLRPAGVRFVQAHVTVLDHLRASGLPWTALAPHGFWQNFLGMAPALRAGVLAAPAGDVAVPFVDAVDVADAAATVLTTTGHEGARYTLTGPEALTHHEIADAFGRTLGRPVSYRPLTPEEARTGLLAAGMNPWQAEGVVELYGMYARDELSAVSDDVPRLLGRPARSLADFLTDNATAFRPTGTGASGTP
jgi:uncharacterized protein YbjT (DUF2867 family)